MNDVLAFARTLLREHGYVAELNTDDSLEALLFESDNVIGFVLAYESVPELLGGWKADSTILVEAHQLGLRRSMDKAWNTYLVLLCAHKASRLEQSLLDSIEEDLVGMRKIARSGIATREETARALLPLLPLLSPPNLGPVNMVEEIRIRTSQLPSSVMDAFFSTRDTATVVQLLEEL